MAEICGLSAKGQGVYPQNSASRNVQLFVGLCLLLRILLSRGCVVGVAHMASTSPSAACFDWPFGNDLGIEPFACPAWDIEISFELLSFAHVF